jgi:hypothetical protein
MKIKFKIIVCLLLSMCKFSHAQINLVLNPSFEQLRNCPSDWNEADSAKYWDWVSSLSPTSGYCKGELFTPCCTNTNTTHCSAPDNRGGYQKARTGNSYIALETIYSQVPVINNLRDYLKGQLSITLQSGKNYCLTFYYSAANEIVYATNRFGAYIDNGMVSGYNCCKDFPITPQVQNNPAIFMTDTMNWVKIQGSFAAIGNENTITLGNFTDSATIQFQMFNSNGNLNPYYNIDDISLLPIDLQPYAGRDTSIAQNDSVYIGRASEVGLDDDCTWYVAGNTTAIDTIAGMWVKPSTTTSYVLEQNICGAISYDTVKVSVTTSGIKKVMDNSGQLKVYPNPSDGNIFISSSDLNGKEWKLEITDITGRTLMQNNYAVNNGSMKLYIQLTNGIYFLQVVSSSNISYTGKIIINK